MALGFGRGKGEIEQSVPRRLLGPAGETQRWFLFNEFNLAYFPTPRLCSSGKHITEYFNFFVRALVNMYQTISVSGLLVREG